MQYQRSVSFVQDLEQLAGEERAVASTALRTFMQACDVASGAAPKLPSWIKVHSTGDARNIWEMQWSANGLTGRATFDVRKAGGDLCIRWRRFGKPTASAVSEPLEQFRMTEQQWSATVKRGTRMLPAAAGMVIFARTPRGETVYLEQERWERHVVPYHITQPPTPRGKSTTTWWPVLHSALGHSTMTLEQVLDLIADAVRLGHWQNAPRGTRLAVYQVPDPQAQVLGVSEVKVSTAPDGRILSAYPSAGANVLAVRERTQEEIAAVAVSQAATQPQTPAFSPITDDEPYVAARGAQTTFG